MPGQHGTGHYQPWLDYLAALPSEQQVATVPLATLAALLGEPLSLTAQTAPSFWGSSGVARRYWLAAGWTARLSRFSRTVTFTRR